MGPLHRSTSISRARTISDGAFHWIRWRPPPRRDQGGAYRSLTLECRQADLDAADALLASYAEETREKVWEWVHSKRKTITIYLDPREANTSGCRVEKMKTGACNSSEL